MSEAFINLTPENISREPLSCIIRARKPHPGVEAKRHWLEERIPEGHVFRRLDVKEAVFIEYAPLETAWVPVEGDHWYYIYCLWADGAYKGKGYGRQLLEYCLQDVKDKGGSGVCMLGAEKQKAWLTDQSFARHFGFETIDRTAYGYELLACSFDGTAPHFTEKAKTGEIRQKELTIYYDNQCPFILQSLDTVKKYCDAEKIPVSINQVRTLKQAKQLPCVFNNWAVFYEGKLQTVNLILDVSVLKRILRRD